MFLVTNWLLLQEECQRLRQSIKCGFIKILTVVCYLEPLILWIQQENIVFWSLFLLNCHLFLLTCFFPCLNLVFLYTGPTGGEGDCSAGG